MDISVDQAPQTSSKTHGQLNILVVEDDFPSCEVLKEYLLDYGQCTCAANGIGGVEAFTTALEAGTPYDLVCLDIMMPEMDGHEALTRIRHIEETHGIGSEPVAVIMTTAKDRSRDMIQAFDEGCASYIVKPVDQGKLIAELKKLELI
ncbi:MAG: response regulator [Phycisphaeraceae bacterium]|nr:response regulator [Phycisphaeraceae bacterium]